MMKIIRKESSENIFPYIAYIPDNIGSHPALLIQLHGAGERGDDYEKLYVHGPAKYIRNGTFDTDAIVICPQCPEG